MKENTVLIIGGGTGGHITPGIALYEEFREKGIPVRFLTGKKDVRFGSLDDVPREDLRLYGAPSLFGNVFSLPSFAARFLFATIKAYRMIRREGVQAVIGMGGYVSAPALVAARLAKISIFLCEQNSVPGRVTVKIAPYAEKIFSTFDGSTQYFPEETRNRILVTGNPIRKKIKSAVKTADARKRFNLQHCSSIVLVIGGSQGALTLNNLMLDLINKYPQEFRDVGIIWSTGEYSYRKFKDAMGESGHNISIYMSPYINDVEYAYAAADVAISRAGAGVMMELAAEGIPSILIPFPHAAMDHQKMNAEEFAAKGAAKMIANEDAVAHRAGPVLFEMLASKTMRQRMGSKARAAAQVDAASRIVKEVSGKQ